jgi:hypothetical protein
VIATVAADFIHPLRTRAAATETSRACIDNCTIIADWLNSRKPGPRGSHLGESVAKKIVREKQMVGLMDRKNEKVA